MTTYISSEGFFNLNASNENVGSYISKQDVLEIFNYDENFNGILSFDDLQHLSFKLINGNEYIDEKKFHIEWHSGKIKGIIPKKGSSLDEIILFALIKKTLPNAHIEKQVRIGRFKMDFKIIYNNQTVFIEFDGPSHFCRTKYGEPEHEPFYKKQQIEDKTGYEVINWAFWIQRCSANLLAIFDKNIQGLGALWSSSYYFSQFCFDNSAHYIESINQRFNVMRNGSYGYFYDENPFGIQKPEHPIIQEILKKPTAIDKILPNGYQNREIWLPEKVLHLL